MKENDHTFFANTSCQYYPCHQGTDTEDFNCLFCYCPLYSLGERCGGNFTYTSSGVKDCSGCAIPHSPGGYERIVGILSGFEKPEETP